MQGEHVVVFGGSSGIGLALAKRLQSLGALVTITGRDAGRLAEARARLGDGVETVAFDITDGAEVARFFEQAPAISHVAVMAGDLVGGRVADTEAAVVRNAMEVRFWGSYHIAHYGCRKIKDRGSITLTSGASAWKPIIGEAVAAASCAAVEALGRSRWRWRQSE
jgi:NAD(P)-dependent dehydrogenase (short-subunit alcohol dehydrogenase family)